MTYEDFLKEMKDEIQKNLGEDVEVGITAFPKNNGVKLDALTVKPRQEEKRDLSPVIYLNPYYTQLDCGMTFEEEVKDILELLKTAPQEDLLSGVDISNYDQIRDKIMYKIVGTAFNADLLKDVPHIPFLDLAIVFYLLLGRDDSGQMTSLVRNCHMEEWNRNLDELWAMARMNTPRDLPEVIERMDDYMIKMIEANLGEEDDNELAETLKNEDEQDELYILSNKAGLNGVSCMLYPGLLQRFADSIGSDLIILPSSIHEVLLARDHEGLDYESFRDMVKTINEETVPVEDQLSNEVYRYNRETDQIMMVGVEMPETKLD